jgi:hypothetical protein
MAPSLGDVYRWALHEKYELQSGHVAVWPPYTDLVLGQVGYVTPELKFEIDGTLGDKGIVAEPASEPGIPNGPSDLVSSDAVKIDFGFDAKTKGFDWLGRPRPA